MWKKVLAATAVMAIAGSPFLYAQHSGGPDGWAGRDRGPDRRPGGAERYRPTQEDIGAFADARIAALKAGLKLTPDQEKNWPAFETAYRDLAKLRTDRMVARNEAQRTRREGDETRDQNQDRTANMIERMKRRADAMAQSATAFKNVAEAAAPLYQSLDEGQKRRFGVLSHMLRPGAMHFAGGPDERRGEGRPGMGFGPRGEGGFNEEPGRDGHHWRFGGGRENGQYGERDDDESFDADPRPDRT